jgi:sugar transferase (PEP-CTERM system associated)
MLRIFRQYYPIRNVIFATGEGVIIYLIVVLVAWVKIGPDIFVLDKWIILKSLLITSVCQLCLYYNDLYDLKITHDLKELAIRLLQALGATAILFGVLYFFAPSLMIGQGIFVLIVGGLIVAIVSWRIGYLTILKNGLFNQKIIIIGSGQLAEEIYLEIKDKKDSGYEVVTFSPDNSEKSKNISYKGLCQKAQRINVRKIIVALQEKRGRFPLEELLQCRTNGVEILEGTSFYEMLMGKLCVQGINPAWLIFSEGFKKSKLQQFMKRAGDLVLSSILLVFVLPLLILTAVLVKIDSPGPVFHSQERLGQNRKPFNILKIRSMVVNAEKLSGPIWAQEKDDRITRVGNVIRKLRIDEIPQLWNIMKGEMSFVGPRPERAFFIEQLEEHVPYYAQRLSVKPGLTGWAQVSYPYGASVEDAIEKLNYDLFYIKNLSFLLDMLIVFRTVKIVLFGKGAR